VSTLQYLKYQYFHENMTMLQCFYFVSSFSSGLRLKIRCDLSRRMSLNSTCQGDFKGAKGCIQIKYRKLSIKSNRITSCEFIKRSPLIEYSTFDVHPTLFLFSSSLYFRCFEYKNSLLVLGE